MAVAYPYFPNCPWSEEFLLADGEDQIIDLQGATLLMHFRPNAESSTLIVEASTDNGKIVIDTVTGLDENDQEITDIGMRILLDAADTLELYQKGDGGNATTDLQITFPDGSVQKKILNLVLEAEITNTRNFDV